MRAKVLNAFDRSSALLGLGVILLAWQLTTAAAIFPRQILVPPSAVFEAGVRLWQSGELPLHLSGSLSRLAFGFVIGSFLGLAFGVALGLSRTLEAWFGPLFHAVRQAPSIAFIPVLVLLLGVEESFKIVIVAKAAFFPVALATSDAVKAIPRSFFEVAQVYRTPLPDFIARIVVPSTLPPILTGFRISLARAWVVLVAAELLAADKGVGQMMEMGRQTFRLDVVMLGVVLTGAIGFSLDRGFKLVERLLVRGRTA